MATVDFPHDILRYPLDSGFSRNTSGGFVQSGMDGAVYNRRITNDRPTVLQIRWTMEGGRRKAMQDFIDNELAGGVKPFRIQLESEGGFIWQEARFTVGGIPQIESVGASSINYRAEIVIRKWVDPYDGWTASLLVYLDEQETTYSQSLESIDIAVNEDWPQ